jgi:site-specific DNA-methyltransferase (adenine-specific)
MREIMPALKADAIITDPPYQATKCAWDKWPIGWPDACLETSNILWCFGSFRMFFNRRDEFSGWKLAQDIVWEKHNGSASRADRFNRVHENAVQFYQGDWESITKNPVYSNDAVERRIRRQKKPAHWEPIRPQEFTSKNDGPRLMRSVIYARSAHGDANNETQKPEAIVWPLMEYSAPTDRKGIIIDPFCGSGTTLRVALDAGHRAIGIDVREEQCEHAAKRIQQEVMNL